MASVFVLFGSQLRVWSITEFFISSHVIFRRSKCIWLDGVRQSTKVVCVVMLVLFSFAVETQFQFKVTLIVLLFQSFVRDGGISLELVVQFSQNHRMVGVGRDLWGSSSPTLLLKQGRLQQAAKDLVQTGLEYLQRRRLHQLPGQLVPVLHHPQSEVVLPQVQTELPMLQFVPLVLSLGTTEKSLAPSS